MESNEQGLTLEEKIMFSILGIIFIVAIGVLIVNKISSNERELKDNNTPITENNGQQNNVRDEETIDIQKENLIEDVQSESPTTNKVATNLSNTTSPKPVVVPTKPVEKPNNIPGIIEWTFKDTMITECFSNTVITLEKYVITSSGTEVEATITVRKLEGNSWNIVDTSTDSFLTTEGTYKYYYTYSNQTKELILIVKNKLEYEKLELLTLTEYNENIDITEENFNDFKETLLNTTIKEEATSEYRKHILTIDKTKQKTNIVPLVITLNEELTEPVLSSSTLGVILSTEFKEWYQAPTSKDIIIWLDLSVIDITSNEINLNINGKNYTLYLEVVFTQPSEEDKPTTDEETDTEEKDETNNDKNDETNPGDDLDSNPEEEKDENNELEEPPSPDESQDDNQEFINNQESLDNNNILNTTPNIVITS